MKFRSKIDAWLAATLIGSTLISVWAAYSAMSQSANVGIVGVVALLAIGAGLPLWLFLSTSYEIKGQILYIFCGPFRWNIPLSEVTRVVPCKSLISSPALSLDRLRIEYGSGKAVLVSPRDQAAFLREIEAVGNKA